VLQLSPATSQMPADDIDTKLCDKTDDADIDTGGLLQFFVNSAAANMPLIGPLLTSVAGQHVKLTASDSLETSYVTNISTCNDISPPMSPSNVSSAACCH